MYPFVICVCGRAIGELYDLFVELRLSHFVDVGSNKDIPAYGVNSIFANSSIHMNLSDIWAILGIELECCKTKLAFQQKMSDYY